MINKILQHNKNNNLTFDSKNHKYFVNGVEYPSVTRRLSKYFPFDRDRIADEVAQKNWTSRKNILVEWDSVKDNGSYVHDLIDKYCKSQSLSDLELTKIKPAIDFFKDNKYKIVASELRVFSKKLGVAGTIDLLLEDGKGKLFIADWKTNRKSIDKNEVFDMALPPFDEFPNNKFYLYSMQLSIYALILKEEYGVDVYDCFLVHLSNDSYQVVDVLDLKYDVQVIF